MSIIISNIIDNAQWIFSGIGVLILGGVAKPVYSALKRKVIPATSPYNAEISFETVVTPVAPDDLRVDYRFSVQNTGSLEITTFRLEAEVPTDLMEGGTSYMAEIKERSNTQYRFFRITDASWAKSGGFHLLFPGDKWKTFGFPLRLAPSKVEQIKNEIRVNLFVNDLKVAFLKVDIQGTLRNHLRKAV